jgi:hypothetical protein
VILTVRLHRPTHALLIEEFEHLGRRRRAGRAAQLMLFGLLYERAHLRPGVSTPEGAPLIPRHAGRDDDVGLAAEADAFVSAILRIRANCASDGDLRGAGR